MKSIDAGVFSSKSLAGVVFILALIFGVSNCFSEEEINMNDGASWVSQGQIVPGNTPVSSTQSATNEVNQATPEDYGNTATPENSQNQASSLTGNISATPGPSSTPYVDNSDLQEEESDETSMAPTAAATTALNSIPTPTSMKAKASPVPSPQASEQATPEKPIMGEGILKMKDVYAAGMKYYKQEDFVQAIRFLKQSLTIKDPYTPKFYYAEANAMLGIIYQFHIIHPDLAFQYYHEALEIDPTTETAKNHIDQVKPSQN
jgi:tetratricopeptide (TPR) repeat protein